jgi:hypothetical protein
MIWRKKKQPTQSLPPHWTQRLWDEFKHHSYDFHCFLGIDGLGVKADFHAELGATDLGMERRYFGFIGGDPSSHKRLVRAELFFAADRKRSEIHGRLPQASAGWGQTQNMSHGYGPPRLSFEVFASLENQKDFEELVVRAKTLQMDHVAVSIWANAIEPWWDTNTAEFSKVFSICRVIFEQQIRLGTQP